MQLKQSLRRVQRDLRIHSTKTRTGVGHVTLKSHSHCCSSQLVLKLYILILSSARLMFQRKMHGTVAPKTETRWSSSLNTGIKLDTVRIHFCSVFYLPIKPFFVIIFFLFLMLLLFLFRCDRDLRV